MTRLILALVSVVALTACGRTMTPTPAPSPQLPATTTSRPLAADMQEETDAVRSVIREYWEGFNSYDKERVLALLTPEYHAVRSERIAADIGLLKQFRVKLGWKEESPPSLRPDGTGQAIMEIKEPLGMRRVQMEFEKRAEGWKITFVEEVPRNWRR